MQISLHYVHIHVHCICIREELGLARGASPFPNKNELPQVDLEPTTLYTLDMYTYMYIHTRTIAGVSILVQSVSTVARAVVPSVYSEGTFVITVIETCSYTFINICREKKERRHEIKVKFLKKLKNYLSE